MMSEFSLNSYLLIFARVIPIIVFSPALGGKMLTGRMRIVLGILISICIQPSIDPIEITNFFSALLAQSVIGVFMAFLSALPFFAVQATGEWIDINRGETLSSLLIPQMDSKASSCGRLFLLLASVIFFTAGYHLELLREIIRSFEIFNLNLTIQDFMSFSNGNCNELLFVKRVSDFFVCVIKLGLPIVFVLWLTDLLLGILNRMAPALQVFYLGIPLKFWLGALMVAIGGTTFIREIESILSSVIHLVS